MNKDKELNFSIVSTAQQFAIKAHDSIGQKRKYDGQPYHYHCARVVTILKEVTENEAVLAAAWLHDVLEDVAPLKPEFSAAKIQEIFGDEILALVIALTDSKLEAGNRATRKDLDRKRLGASSHEAKTIKLADLIDNLIDIRKHDFGFYRIIADETRLTLPYLEGGNSQLFERLVKLLDEDK